MKLQLLLLVFFTLSISIYGQKWTQIQPAESTLDDVEKILGKAEVRGYSTRHYLDDGIYQIDYSDGKCNPKWDRDWDVPEWRVFKVFYSPKEAPKVSTLGINLNKMKKTINSPDTPDVFDYADESKGIIYTVQKDFNLKAKVVTNITTLPSKKYNNVLCRN